MENGPASLKIDTQIVNWAPYKSSPVVRTCDSEDRAENIESARVNDPTIASAVSNGLRFKNKVWITYTVPVSPQSAHSTNHRGFVLRHSDKTEAKKPGILLLHTATGVHDDFLFFTAERYAALGYVIFAADMYGEEAAQLVISHELHDYNCTDCPSVRGIDFSTILMA